MKKWTLCAALLCAWLGNSAALAAGDAAAGKAKAAVCAACHGADGKAIQPAFPNLAGQHAAYIEKQLQDYKSGARVNALMVGQVAALSDQDMADLAAHFSSLASIQSVASEENLALGESIYRGGITNAGIAACSACHGPTGVGNPQANFPVLAGQNTQYIADQLRLFRSGERANDANEMMRGIAHRMTDKEIDAVANYITGLYSAK